MIVSEWESENGKKATEKKHTKNIYICTLSGVSRKHIKKLIGCKFIQNMRETRDRKLCGIKWNFIKVLCSSVVKFPQQTKHAKDRKFTYLTQNNSFYWCHKVWKSWQARSFFYPAIISSINNKVAATAATMYIVDATH